MCVFFRTFILVQCRDEGRDDGKKIEREKRKGVCCSKKWFRFMSVETNRTREKKDCNFLLSVWFSFEAWNYAIAWAVTFIYKSKSREKNLLSARKVRRKCWYSLSTTGRLKIDIYSEFYLMHFTTHILTFWNN